MKQFQTLVIGAHLVLAGFGSAVSHADEVRVAVAANFTAAMKEISSGFERSTGHTAVPSFGSTGKLYTQIINGAPFEVFLAADQERPRLLEETGKATDRFTYADGKLVLWSASPDVVDAGGKVLSEAGFRKLAIANPKTAPYGQAAMQTLDNLGLAKALEPNIVKGDSIAQTYQFIVTGNAELGFVALAQVALSPQGSRWIVPEELYAPIRQDAVLLEKGKDRPAALAFMEYLKGADAKGIIERFGYGTN